MRIQITGTVIVTLAAMLLIACGGGADSTASSTGGGGAGGGSGGGSGGGAGGGTGGGTPDPGDPVFGINGGGAWVISGALSQFGSVVVNGVRYDTTGSEIIVNGQPAIQADLAQGQVVAVRGEVAEGGLTGVAERVEYESSVRGGIREIDHSAGLMRILGQQVRAGLETIYGASIGIAGIEGLGAGDAVVVSGYRDSTGALDATRIDRDPSPGTAELRGVASAVDPASGRLRINDLGVDFSAAALEGFASGAPANGDTVFVRGPEPAAGQPLVAGLLAWRPVAVDAVPEENVDLEGLVTRFASLTDLDVAGLRVVIGEATELVASAAAEIVLDAFVDVEGSLDADGRLAAARVQVIPRADIEVEARIDGVDLVAGTIQLLGIDAFTTARTRFEDDDGRQLVLADLRAGDDVEIAGYYWEGRFTAVRVARDVDDGQVEIEGPVMSLAQPEFHIGGIRIVTDSLTEFDGNDAPLTADEFFTIAEGRRVEVEGTWNGEFVRAEEVELED
jgi:hypothetical protein